ncbi:GTP pyrophosphokinase [Calidifontibacter indicus]|uniref:RelA/SpoT family protein n=1 Tax=Calidifontibacter indicus TaxID=419650 RepID=A0A3D9UQF1_9MICO|nr:GTP pyrophosphokinase [Calidifontibacter indicus]REF30210.1 RelA/SpoT family protein [Calidifontibacter indicus]
MTRRPHRQAVAAYAANHAETQAATVEFVDLITAIIDDAGINYLSITGRAKSPKSFAGKVARRADELTDPLVEITDQVGVRVITYVQSDVQAVAALLTEQFGVLEDRDLGLEAANEGRFGYASRHLLVSRDKDAHAYDPARCASVQLRTVLQHAWAEFEHDARYKGDVPPEHASDLDRRFTLAAGLLELADREFSIIRDRLQSGLGEVTEVISGDDTLSATDLATFLAGRYTGSGFSRAEHYALSAQLLGELGITSIEQLSEVLATTDSDGTMRAMGYRYPPGAARRLDDDLLASFRERYVDLPGNADRRSTLRGRLQRLPDRHPSDDD